MGSTTARKLLEELPTRLNLSRGHARITAEFVDGSLQLPLTVSMFRVSASDIDAITYTQPAIAGVADDLEEVARQIGADTGNSKIVAEYEFENRAGRDLRGARARLRWVDVCWSL